MTTTKQMIPVIDCQDWNCQERVSWCHLSRTCDCDSIINTNCPMHVFGALHFCRPHVARHLYQKNREMIHIILYKIKKMYCPQYCTVIIAIACIVVGQLSVKSAPQVFVAAPGSDKQPRKPKSLTGWTNRWNSALWLFQRKSRYKDIIFIYWQYMKLHTLPMLKLVISGRRYAP